MWLTGPPPRRWEVSRLEEPGRGRRGASGTCGRSPGPTGASVRVPGQHSTSSSICPSPGNREQYPDLPSPRVPERPRGDGLRASRACTRGLQVTATRAPTSVLADQVRLLCRDTGTIAAACGHPLRAPTPGSASSLLRSASPKMARPLGPPPARPAALQQGRGEGIVRVRGVLRGGQRVRAQSPGPQWREAAVTVAGPGR